MGHKHWTTRLISQVLCCTIFLQTGIAAAGQLPAPRDTREWVSDERLAALVKAEPPMEVAAAEETPEPVRIASLLQRPAPRESLPPSSILTDSAQGAETPSAPAVRPRPVEPVEEAPRVPLEVRPEDLPPFPPGMQGATLARAAGTLQAVTASSLTPSWNLASVQNEPVDKSPASVFSSIAGKLTRVFAYDACTPADPWKVYDPADAPGSDLTQVDQKIGFWIEMTAPASVPNPGSLADETTVHLCPGWNLIGFPAEQARPVRTALSSIEGKYTRVFGFDPSDATDPWELYDVAVPSWANDLDLMQPGRGYWVLATAETDLTIANAGAEPEVAITAPADLGVVTAPTDVIGTVRSDRLQGWTLSYRAHGEADAVVFASGSTPVVNGRLATFDPTLLLNGGYTIELTATDFNGQSSVTEVDVSVQGQMKVGNFTLSYLDLEIPLSGLPIQVYRNYDSRDKRRGDFGVGWKLELRQGSYRNNRKPGDGWQISSGFLPCQNVQETRGHNTTIRISDREVYRFRLRLVSSSPTLGGCFAQARFEFVDGPVPGASLAILGNTQVIYQNGTDYVVDFEDLDVYEPQQVRLTTRDGRAFELDLQQGVTRLEDLNGNTLSITPTSITHSSGLSLAFQRDGLGRIASVTDPEGASIAYSYDSAGDLVAVTDRESNTTRFSYNGSHGLLSIEDPLGRQPIRNEYDDSGRLLRHLDAFGKKIEYDHRINDRQELITDRLGYTRLLEYDDRGNVVRELDANGKEILRSVDSRDNLLSETDPLGYTKSFSYDGSNSLTGFTDQSGGAIRYTHDSRGYPASVTDARGKVTTSTYDSRGNLLSISDPLGNTTSLTYDSRGNALTETDAEGNVRRFEYDGFGNLTKEIDALGHETAITYDRNGRPLTRTTARTTPSGTETLVWQFTYDSLGRLIRTTRPDDTSTSTVYDPVGNVLETLDELGRKTTYVYDAMGRLTTTTYPDGTSEQIGYDANGRRTSTVDQEGRTTRFEYDPVGRLLKTIVPDGSFTTYAYDDAGRLVTAVDSGGNATHSEHDAAGRRIKVRDALGHETRYGYDAAGNRSSFTDARGQTTTYEYDEAGSVIRVVFPDGTSRATAYDRLGRKISETDQAGKTTQFAYDAAGRLASVTDALGQVTRYTYDELGNRISQISANGHVTSFEYDKAGRLIQRTLPLGASETLSYDAAGRLERRTDFNGKTVTYTYDAAGRPIRRGYPDGNAVSFTYTPSGRRATVVDSRGTTSYEYDGRNRLSRLTYPDGRALSYAHDQEGNRTSLTAVLGSTTLTTVYSHDALNRLETVTDPQGRVYTHSYDANGNRVSVAYPNEVETTYSYDSLNRLTRLETRASVGDILQSYTYTLGAAGNRTRIDEHDGTARTYEYDALYRLTKETAAGGSGLAYVSSFVYDPVGNRLEQTRTDGSGTTTIPHTYDERDRLLTEGGANLAWDANGNLVEKSGADGATYVWDIENRLIRVTRPDGTVVTHAYDADGNRVRTEVTPSTGPPAVTEYLVDSSSGLSHVVAETDGSGNLKAYYVRGDDLLAIIRPASTRFYHADGLGSIRVLTNETGAVTDRYVFSAFGELLDHAGDDPNAYLFAGESLDFNSGFYYLRARWMDPGVGRFASADPFSGLISDPVSLHRYLYANANPLNVTDPTGKFSLSSLSVSSSMIGIGARYVIQTTGFALLGGGFGLVDAWLGDEPLWPAAKQGFVFGLGIGAFWPFRVWRLFATFYMVVSGGVGGVQSFQNGKPAQGVFRIGLALFMVAAGVGRAKPTRITRGDPAGIERIGWHFEANFKNGEASGYPPNRAMLQRLSEGRWEMADQEFYRHEMLEAELMEKGLPYEDAHAAALREYGVTERDLYHPEVIQSFPELFNDSWFTHWHMPPPNRN